ncbi:TetR/AcrR family transcriptional regulator [Thalassotalea euphylliae]|uniref:TetR/AcrR family transcriptional regulator n=1 Tax=Thalassotalea euphylliae TaxID=1655234 RepID=A0A3E0TYE8_9GAMM|nr:TetR/AcrR family transcriptional regulator [Thalassotalea euphylliae]
MYDLPLGLIVLPKSVGKIVSAARECFFQHGYHASNVSLIARYAGISRATIYKNFSSKEALFQAMVQRQFAEYDIALSEYAEANADFWQETENLFVNRCQGVFDDISSQVIRTELVHAGHSLCQALMDKEQEDMLGVIINRIEQEIAANRLTLERINMTSAQFASAMQSMPIGIFFSSNEANDLGSLKQVLTIFRVATEISN